MKLVSFTSAVHELVDNAVPHIVNRRQCIRGVPYSWRGFRPLLPFLSCQCQLFSLYFSPYIYSVVFSCFARTEYGISHVYPSPVPIEMCGLNEPWKSVPPDIFSPYFFASRSVFGLPSPGYSRCSSLRFRKVLPSARRCHECCQAASFGFFVR